MTTLSYAQLTEKVSKDYPDSALNNIKEMLIMGIGFGIFAGGFIGAIILMAKFYKPTQSLMVSLILATIFLYFAGKLVGPYIFNSIMDSLPSTKRDELREEIMSEYPYVVMREELDFSNTAKTLGDSQPRQTRPGWRVSWGENNLDPIGFVDSLDEAVQIAKENSTGKYNKYVVRGDSDSDSDRWYKYYDIDGTEIDVVEI